MFKQTFEYLAGLLQTPGALSSQAAFNAARLAAFESAYRCRPQWLPMTHTLPAAAQTMPITARIGQLQFDVLVHGAITDGEARNVKFYKDYDDRAIVRYGSDPNTKLSLDAIAGHSVATAGYAGVKDYPEPYLVQANRLLSVDMYQETNPGALETVSTVFCGTRVFPANAADALLSADNRRKVQQWIQNRIAPETNYAVCPVAFAADGTATTQTPSVDEPMIILGFRSTFTDALVNLGFDGDSQFAKTQFPVWALCAEPNNGHKLFEMLRTPLPVLPNQILLFGLTNTIDGALFATDGNIEIIYQTV